MSTASLVHHSLDQALRRGDAAEVLRLQLQREVLRICASQSSEWVGKLIAAKAVSGGEAGARAQAVVIAGAINQGLASGNESPLEHWSDLPADYSGEGDNLLVYQFVPREAAYAAANAPQRVRMAFVMMIDPVLAWDFGGVILSTVADGVVNGPRFREAAELIAVGVG